MTMGSNNRLFHNSSEAVTAFSALHLLRSYNHLLTPPGTTSYPHNSTSFAEDFHLMTSQQQQPRDSTLGNSVAGNTITLPTTLPMIGAFQPYPLPLSPLESEFKSSSSVINRSFPNNLCFRRPRGEKKPIPDEQKDDKYYERRKRNNQAAKKSRDARKIREDQIALRASMLEHENAVLRAQVLTIREEAQSLRQLLLLQRTKTDNVSRTGFQVQDLTSDSSKENPAEKKKSKNTLEDI